MRTSSSDRLASKRGFTLLEMLMVIVIMGLVTALVLPNINKTLSTNAVQTVFFQFQTKALEHRATAYRQNRSLVLVDSGAVTDDPEADPAPVDIQFPGEGWTYRLSQPMKISAGGVCDAVTAEVFQEGQLAFRLESQPDCSFRGSPYEPARQGRFHPARSPGGACRHRTDGQRALLDRYAQRVHRLSDGQPRPKLSRRRDRQGQL